MEQVIRELKAFVAKLMERPDLEVLVANVRDPATAAELASLVDVPDELRAFYAATNGVHVEWRFREPSHDGSTLGGGRIQISKLSEWTRFESDDETASRFGETMEALFFDEILPEGATWIVRDRESKAHRIVFSPSSRKTIEEGVVAGSSIADYLRNAMSNGFAYWWPVCFRERPNISNAEQEQTIRRFRAMPEQPSNVQPGRRVRALCFVEGARGNVLDVHEASPSDATNYFGTRLAKVQLDEGTVAWIGTRYMTAHDRVDAYERLRLALPRAPFREGPLLVLEELARAIGPVTSYSPGPGPSNARVAAGIIAAHPLNDVIRWLVELYDAARATQIQLFEPRPLAASGDELSPMTWGRKRWQHTPCESFEGLLYGLSIVLQHRSAHAARPPVELVDPAAVRDLARCGELKIVPGRKPYCGERELAQSVEQLVETIERGEILEAPSWGHGNQDHARALGLPDDGVTLLSGSA